MKLRVVFFLERNKIKKTLSTLTKKKEREDSNKQNYK